MTAAILSSAMRRFVDYFGELGPRWGLPAEACRVHAYLYLVASPSSEDKIAGEISLDTATVAEALAFLVDYRMVDREGPSNWRTSGDPWDMLISGLEQRRRRELPPALATLRECHRDSLADGTTRQKAAGQIGRMLALVEDLAALDARAQRLPPRILRGLVGMSGRAARLMDRALGTRGGERP